MSARDRLIELFDAGGPHHLFSSEEVADSILALHAHELAEKQKSFFGDISAQGNDGNWYGVSDWLTEVEK